MESYPLKFKSLNELCSRLTGLLVIILLISGCVSNKKFTEVQDQRDQMQEDLASSQHRADSLQQMMTKLRNEQQNRLANLEESLKQLQNQLKTAQNTVDQLQQRPDCPEAMIKGVVFKVQIGAFRNKVLSDNLDTSVNLDIEYNNGLQKIVLGQFRDYFKADSLQNKLRAMGVKDAWIVPYRDGNRVLLKDVLQEVMNSTADNES